jgi:hypothetical protein
MTAKKAVRALVVVAALAACRSEPGTPDPACAVDGVCNEVCARGEDRDCPVAGCLADGVCNGVCGAWDPDCTAETCGVDGACNPRCAADPDCGTSPCAGDGRCVMDCGAVDPDCAAVLCAADGECHAECPDGVDPDCDEECAADGECDPRCGDDDPDCAGECAEDGVCNAECGEVDPDCDDDPCAIDGYCDPECVMGHDPDCAGACDADGACEPSCPPGYDPDCGDVCGSRLARCCDAAACAGDLVCTETWSGDVCLEPCAPARCTTGEDGVGSCVEFSLHETRPVCLAVTVDIESNLCEPGASCLTGNAEEGACVPVFGDEMGGYGLCLAACERADTTCTSGTICIDGRYVWGEGGRCVSEDLQWLWD